MTAAKAFRLQAIDLVYIDYKVYYVKGLFTAFTWGGGIRNRLQLRNAVYFKSSVWFNGAVQNGPPVTIWNGWVVTPYLQF